MTGRVIRTVAVGMLAWAGLVAAGCGALWAAYLVDKRRHRRNLDADRAYATARARLHIVRPEPWLCECREPVIEQLPMFAARQCATCKRALAADVLKGGA